MAYRYPKADSSASLRNDSQALTGLDDELRGVSAAPPLEDEAAARALDVKVKDDRKGDGDGELPEGIDDSFVIAEQLPGPIVEEEVGEVESIACFSKKNQHRIGENTRKPVRLAQSEQQQSEDGDKKPIVEKDKWKVIRQHEDDSHGNNAGGSKERRRPAVGRKSNIQPTKRDTCKELR